MLFGRYEKHNQGCSGTLVGDKYVITAAHCTYGNNPEDLFVSIGDTTLDSEKEATSIVMAIDNIMVCSYLHNVALSNLNLYQCTYSNIQTLVGMTSLMTSLCLS